MVTASKPMAASDAATYFTKDNYYIKDGLTEVGQWNGKGAEKLGLSGEIKEKEFIEVLNGYAPRSLNQDQIKQLETIAKEEKDLRSQAVDISKLPDSDVKTAKQKELQAKIEEYNERRLDFHKDVKTEGLHSQIKELKAMGTKDPEIQKEIRSLEKSLNELVADDFRVGDCVSPSDRENFGEIKQIDKETNKILVTFTNPETGKTAEKLFDAGNLTNHSSYSNRPSNEQSSPRQLVRDGRDQHGIATHRAGFDFTTSAPKSVSVMALVGGDTKLLDAHNEATAKAMEYLQSHFAQTRDYNENGERERVNTENLVIAKFDHYTSRATGKEAIPDPQLHSHNMIMNMTANGDKWMSLEPQQLYTAQKLVGQIYQNELARAVKDAGYAVEWNKSGGNYTFEIKGVDKEIRDGFSSRTGQINAMVVNMEKELGRELTAEEKNNITLSSRAGKDEQDIDKLKESWDESLKDMGHTKESLMEATKGHVNDKTIATDATEAVRMAVQNLHEQKAVFGEHELTREALKAAQGSASLEEIRQAIAANEKELLIDSTDTHLVGRDKDNKATKLFSSKEILKSEAMIEKAVKDGKNTGAIMSKEDFVSNYAHIEKQKISQAEAGGKKYFSLTDGQQSALEHIATSNDRYIGIQGDAGSGKTTALERMSVMAEMLEKTLGDKVDLIGLAPTNIAAKNIQKDAGISSRTVDSFINKPLDGTEGRQQVYLVDESSMLDTVKMSKLVNIAEKNGAKVVFIGDTKQLKPVGAGAMFDRLQKTGQMEFAQVTEVLRQQTDMTKDAVNAFKNIETLGRGLDALSAAGKLIEAKDGDMNKVRDTFIQNVASDFIAAGHAASLPKDERPADLKNGLDSVISLVSTNEDRHAFNKDIREKLVEAGIVSANGQLTNTLEQKRLNSIDARFVGNYEIGNVLVAGNQKGLGSIKNGTKTKVSEINRADNTLKITWETKSGSNEKWISADRAAKHFTAHESVEKEFAAGDRIAFEQKDKQLKVDNGETGIIKSINENGHWNVAVGDREITIDPEKYPYVSHAYAMTVHKSQGQSIDRVHVYADSSKGGLNTNAGYVQMSRAKYDLTVYTDNREELEAQYKKEQIAENAGDYTHTGKFAEDRETAMTEASNTEISPRTTESVDPQDLKDAWYVREAAKEQKLIDSSIDSMRENVKIQDARAAQEWQQSKKITNTNGMRADHIIKASTAGATAKDLKAGIRYQQMQKLEAKIMEKGEVDLRSIRQFVENKGFENQGQKDAFMASQARQEKHLESMVKAGIMIKDPDNQEKYELAVGRDEYQEYRTSEKAHDSRQEIAEGAWNKAVGDKLFEKARAKVDSMLIAGGKWNPKEALDLVKNERMLTKDVETIYHRLEARYERLEDAGLVQMKGGAYHANDTDELRNFINSPDDQLMAWKGEGRDVTEWKVHEKFEHEHLGGVGGILRDIDNKIESATKVDFQTWKNDIYNSFKEMRWQLGVRSDHQLIGNVAAGVLGVVLGTTKTAARGIAGIAYDGSKEIIKLTGELVKDALDRHYDTNPDNVKAIEHLTGSEKMDHFQKKIDEVMKENDFGERVDNLTTSKKSNQSDSNHKDNSFNEKIEEIIGKGRDNESDQKNENDEKEHDRDGGSKEKEAEREERESD